MTTMTRMHIFHLLAQQTAFIGSQRQIVNPLKAETASDLPNNVIVQSAPLTLQCWFASSLTLSVKHALSFSLHETSVNDARLFASGDDELLDWYSVCSRDVILGSITHCYFFWGNLVTSNVDESHSANAHSLTVA